MGRSWVQRSWGINGIADEILKVVIESATGLKVGCEAVVVAECEQAAWANLELQFATGELFRVSVPSSHPTNQHPLYHGCFPLRFQPLRGNNEDLSQH